MAAERLVFPLVPVRRSAGVAFGNMRSRRRGLGSETASIREYQPGDDIRRIDWNASARMSAALGRDEFLVREHYAEQARSVFLAADRSPSMGLYPEMSPWLSKPRALAACARLVAGSAAAASCPLGVLDGAVVARPRQVRTSVEAALRATTFDRADGLASLLEQIAVARIQAGSFVFVCSDFLSETSADAWERAVARRLELVPVVIQDPVLEQSFPALGGLLVPIADPTGRARSLVRLSRREARALKERNEERLTELESLFRRLGLDWVAAGTDDPRTLHAGFVRWAESRQRRAAA